MSLHNGNGSIAVQAPRPTLTALRQRVDEAHDELLNAWDIVDRAATDLATTRRELERRIELKRARDARYRARKRAELKRYIVPSFEWPPLDEAISQ
jgi:hypothetical protein